MGENEQSAEKPRTDNGTFYHTNTGLGDLAKMVVVAGAQGRVKLIQEHLNGAKYFENGKRGIYSCTGFYKDVGISASTSGMGSASVFITLPEIRQSTGALGEEIIIRQGSCGSVMPESNVGDVIIVNGARSWDAASLIGSSRQERKLGFAALAAEDWFSPSLYKVADHTLVELAKEVGCIVGPGRIHVGQEYTTADFENEQGRPDMNMEIPDYLCERHEEVMQRGMGCYSMEAAAFYRSMNSQRVLAVNAVYANRHTDEFEAGAGDELATQLILEVCVELARRA